MLNPKIKEMANKIVEYLMTLPEGSELSTSEAYKVVFNREYYDLETEYDFLFAFDLNAQVWRVAKRKGLILDDSKYADMATGLPFNIPYVVKKQKG